MFSSRPLYIGVDPGSGPQPFTYAALDADLRPVALAQGDLQVVLAFLSGLNQAVVAISSPQRPNQGVMRRPEVREQLSPPPRSGRWTDFRLAEYLLRQHHITCPRTPAQEENCSTWVRMGFSLYRKLEAQGFHAYPSQDKLHLLEVYPHACFCALLGQAPFAKTTLEGRIQRQLVLYEHDLHLPDPMLFFEEITRHRLLQGILPLDSVYNPQQLDAIAAAYTAWLAGNRPKEICLLGDPEEGQVAIPAAELKRRY